MVIYSEMCHICKKYGPGHCIHSECEISSQSTIMTCTHHDPTGKFNYFQHVRTTEKHELGEGEHIICSKCFARWLSDKKPGSCKCLNGWPHFLSNGDPIVFGSSCPCECHNKTPKTYANMRDYIDKKHAWFLEKLSSAYELIGNIQDRQKKAFEEKGDERDFRKELLHALIKGKHWDGDPSNCVYCQELECLLKKYS